MNKGEFIALLNNPQEIDKGFIPELQNVVNDYPYFQSAQLLLTKAFHSSQNLNFESSLKKTAAYAANRKQLHALLFSNVATTTLDQSSSESETKQELSPPPNAEETSSLHTAKEEADKVEQELETSQEIEVPTPSVEVSSELPIGNSIELSEKIETTLENDENLNHKLEQQIISSAISSSILLEVSDEIPEIDTLTNAHKIEKEVSPTPEKAEDKTEESDRSFSDWIKHFGDNSAPEEVEENIGNTLYIKTSKEKTEFYSATKMAKLSVQEDDDLVTETLANIYADQGNYEKAIKAFQKLQLKNPEKRVYFAGRIKEIQNQINS